MGGAFEKKPGGTSLVQEAAGDHLAAAAPGKRTLTSQLEAGGAASSPEGAPRSLVAAGGAHVAERVGVDPTSVRVHEDGVAEGMGARAVTKGRDVHFAKGELGGPDADFLLGHELAHVVQQGQGAATTQAKRADADGHGALEAEADRVGHAAARGDGAGTIEGRATAGLAQRFDSFEHKEIGDDATKGSHGETKTVELAPSYRVSYGEMVALGGDFFGSIEEVRSLAAVDGKGAGTREEIEYVRRVKLPAISDDERTKRTKEFSEAAVHAADKRYYKLAASNPSHFANPETGDAAKSTLDKANATHQEIEAGADGKGHLKTVPNNAAGFFRKNHLIAIAEAVAAGKAGKSIDSALAANAFSDHFLTDSFSSGHNRTARTSATQYWNSKEPMFFHNFKGFMAEKLAYYINDHNTAIGIASVDFIKDQAAGTLDKTLETKGMPDFQFGDLVSGAIHDYDNENGVAVKVEGADKTIYGDDNLAKGDTKGLVVKAVQASVADIEAAYEAAKSGQGYPELYSRIAPTGLFRAEELMPVVKPDGELAPADRSVKWDFADVGGLISDAKFRTGLKIFLRSKKTELANVGATLDAAYKREAFDKAIVGHMEGEEGVGLIWQVLQWTPNTGGGIGGHNQDDNALDYFNKAKAKAGGLASLMWSARANLLKDLVEDYTSGGEEDAIFELLTSCGSDADVRKVIEFVTWERLEDEVGDRFSKRYPKGDYGKKAA